MKTEKEFAIEFVIFGKRIRTYILSEDEQQAKERLFSAVIKQIKIEIMAMPDNEWNNSMNKADQVFNILGRFSNPNLQ
ncbi:MAG: hypothetical protein H6574_22910 [Lewinellaceae bacterium]|nr:hypothetical protein [Lewinellaceae bacterium]